jgi:PadR family transcriptional regulator, regulatory protein PadR
MVQHPGIARPKSLIVAHLLLLLAEEPRHGYELTESLRLCDFRVTTSAVYREMARLQEDGMVRSFWQTSQARGPARHMYELTPAGQEDLAACADDVRRLSSHLAEYLSRFALVAHTNGEVPEDSAPVKPRRRWPVRPR